MSATKRAAVARPSSSSARTAQILAARTLTRPEADPKMRTRHARSRLVAAVEDAGLRDQRVPAGPRRRQLRQRLHPPPAARRVDREPALALPGLRRADRGARQPPRPRLAAAAGPLPRLPRADLVALPRRRGGERAAVAGARGAARPAPADVRRDGA